MTEQSYIRDEEDLITALSTTGVEIHHNGEQYDCFSVADNVIVNNVPSTLGYVQSLMKVGLTYRK